MAIGLSGIGGFAEGLTEGYSKGTALRLAQQRDEREAKAFEMDQKMKQAQVDEMERKKAYNDQVARGMAELDARLSGGTIGGVAVDEFGQELGPMQYANPAAAKASGLSFKEGTKIEKAPEQLTQTQIDRMRADVFQKARIDNKLYDEDAFLKNRQLNKELKKEGVFEAFELFDQTGDSDKAIELFNKNGNRKLPKGSFMVKETDVETGFPTNVVYAPGKDGKPQKITSSFEMQLLYTPEKMLDYGIAMTKEKFTQGKATERVNIQEAGQDRRNERTLANAREIKRAEIRADENKTLATTLNNRYTAIFRNPTSQMEADRNKRIESEVGMLTRQLMDAGMNMQTAINAAEERVFKRYNVNTEPLQTPQN